MDTEHQVPIWFFVGGLLLVYGVLIFGGGVYAWLNPPPVEHRVKLFEYHADEHYAPPNIGVGALYLWLNWPWGKKSEA